MENLLSFHLEPTLDRGRKTRRLFLILAGIFAVFGLAYIAIGIALDGGLTLLFGGVVTLLNALA